jgi:hypothetical protein
MSAPPGRESPDQAPSLMKLTFTTLRDSPLRDTMAYRPKRPLLVQMRHLLKSGAVAKPKWYDIACMVPPDEPRMQAGRPKFINMPEVPARPTSTSHPSHRAVSSRCLHRRPTGRGWERGAANPQPCGRCMLRLRSRSA